MTDPGSDKSKLYMIFGCGYLGNRVKERWQKLLRHVIVVSRTERHETTPSNDVLSYSQLAQLDQPSAPVQTVMFSAGMGPTESTQSQWLECLTQAIDFSSRQKCRFVFVSSTGVYSQSTGQWVDESMPAQPSRQRAQLCRKGEDLIRSSLDDFFICRLAGIYGPNRLPRLQPLKNGEPIPGNPDAWLNLIQVEDAAEIIVNLAQLDQSGEIVNVADGCPVLRSDYFQQICDLCHFPTPRFQQEKPDGNLGKRIDITRLKQLLGDNVKTRSLAAGIKDAIQ